MFILGICAPVILASTDLKWDSAVHNNQTIPYTLPDPSALHKSLPIPWYIDLLYSAFPSVKNYIHPFIEYCAHSDLKTLEFYAKHHILGLAQSLPWFSPLLDIRLFPLLIGTAIFTMLILSSTKTKFTPSLKKNAKKLIPAFFFFFLLKISLIVVLTTLSLFTNLGFTACSYLWIGDSLTHTIVFFFETILTISISRYMRRIGYNIGVEASEVIKKVRLYLGMLNSFIATHNGKIYFVNLGVMMFYSVIFPFIEGFTIVVVISALFSWVPPIYRLVVMCPHYLVTDVLNVFGIILPEILNGFGVPSYMTDQIGDLLRGPWVAGIRIFLFQIQIYLIGKWLDTLMSVFHRLVRVRRGKTYIGNRGTGLTLGSK